MPQVTVNYTENLPSSDNSYKTRRFAMELTQEVPDGVDVTKATQSLFLFAKANVRSQVEQAKAELEMTGMTSLLSEASPLEEAKFPKSTIIIRLFYSILY
jgi:hypothetical protein